MRVSVTLTGVPRQPRPRLPACGQRRIDPRAGGFVRAPAQRAARSVARTVKPLRDDLAREGSPLVVAGNGQDRPRVTLGDGARARRGR